MSFSIGAFYESVACNGLDNKAPLTDTHLYTVEGDYAKFNRDLIISKYLPFSAVMANLESVQLYKTTEVNRPNSAYYSRDQTSQRAVEDWLDANIQIKKGDRLLCKVDNANNAQVDGVLFVASEQQGFHYLDRLPAGKYPNAKWDMWTATTALTGGAWSNPGTITTKHNYEVDKEYQIIAMMAHSATMYGARLIYPGKTWRPGIPGADLPELQRPYFADFGKFSGDNLPELECLASGNDGDVYFSVLINPL